MATHAEPVTRRGATANFVVLYQISLGNLGIQVAEDLLQTCEAQYRATVIKRRRHDLRFKAR
jgi:hypothetical protein